MGFLDNFIKSDKQLTPLEAYKDYTITTYQGPYTTPLQEEKALEVLPLLEKLIERKKTPFGTDETLINILEFYINNSLSNNFENFIEQAKDLYDTILPLGNETENSNQLTKLFEKMFEPSGIFEQKLFNIEFYNLFQNKANYLLLMKTICKDTRKNKKYLSSLINYAITNREYFTNEDLFTNNIQSTVLNLKECLTTGESTEDLLTRLTTENKKRVGIYNISEESLEYIDDLLNNAESVLAQLKSQCKISETSSKTLKENLENSIEKLKKTRENQQKILKQKQEELLVDFKKEMQKITTEEKQTFTDETDKLITEINNLIQTKINELTLVTNGINKNVTAELERIRKTGNKVQETINKTISEHLELQQILTTYTPIQELITKLGEAEEIIQLPKIKTETSIHLPQPIIITGKEIPADINPYFDTRIPFVSRYNQIVEKIEKNKENGELYHEKFTTLIKMIIEDCNPYLWGNSGLGKTYMINQAFNILNLDYRPINKILEDYDIIGSMLPNGDYSNPLWYQCYKYGLGAFLDELDSSNSEATIVINSFTSNKKDSFYPFPNQEIVYRHPNFRIVAAGNTTGNGSDIYFSDRKKLDESVQQRLMPLYLEPDSRIEKEILKNYPNWAEFIENFRKATNSYAKDQDLLSAPGEVTTRDVEKIKQMKDNHSFTDEEILDYQVIETKDEDYLGHLTKTLNNIYKTKEYTTSEEIYKSFVKKANLKRKKG